MTTLSIRLPDQTARALDELADLTDRPKSYLVLKALDAYLEEYADYQIALDRWLDKDDPIVSEEELLASLDEED